jgi:hypothetical protein
MRATWQGAEGKQANNEQTMDRNKRSNGRTNAVRLIDRSIDRSIDCLHLECAVDRDDVGEAEPVG